MNLRTGKVIKCIICDKEFYTAKWELDYGRKCCTPKCRGMYQSLSRLGKNHSGWKGNNPEYRTLHMWLCDNFGRSGKCELCGKFGSGKQIHWAKVKGKEYERKRENFWHLCVRCHLQYDGNLANLQTRNSRVTK